MKKQKKIIIISTITITLILLLCGCEEKNNTNTDKYIENITPHKIMYKVTGSGTSSVSVTYENSQGGTEQLSDAILPWSRTFYSMHKGDWVYISAQNNEEYGCITVEIYLDDILVKDSFSCGAYVIATASGFI